MASCLSLSAPSRSGGVTAAAFFGAAAGTFAGARVGTRGCATGCGTGCAGGCASSCGSARGGGSVRGASGGVCFGGDVAAGSCHITFNQDGKSPFAKSAKPPTAAPKSMTRARTAPQRRGTLSTDPRRCLASSSSSSGRTSSQARLSCSSPGVPSSESCWSTTRPIMRGVVRSRLSLDMPKGYSKVPADRPSRPASQREWSCAENPRRVAAPYVDGRRRRKGTDRSLSPRLRLEPGDESRRDLLAFDRGAQAQHAPLPDHAARRVER